MKSIKDFLTFTNLSGKRIKFTLILVLASVLYGIVYSFVNTIIYMGNLFYYYGALYFFVIWCAYIFMIITFLFLQRKRGVDEKLQMKSYILPLLGVQSIFYVLMLLLGVGIYMLSFDYASITSIASMFTMLFAILYIPWQLCCFFQIYDGVKNPCKIIWNALKKIIVHYRSCFYGLFVLFVIAMCYQMIMDAVFEMSSSFSTFTLVQDIMLKSNPFVDCVGYFANVSLSAQAWLPGIVSLLYGLIMCYVFVNFLMLMICVHDEDIKV